MKDKAYFLVIKHIPQVLLALVLVVALTPMTRAFAATGMSSAGTSDTSAAGTTPAQGSAAADKDEVVYALLDGGGAPKSGYVINHFKVGTAGTLVDYGAYDSTMNLTSTQQLTVDAGQISVPVETGDFYYEGVLSTVDLPWNIAVSYKLDGASVDPSALAGSSGKLEIDISTTQNKGVDPVFYKNYLLQIQLTLPTDKVSDLEATGATVASVGSNEQVAFMVMPDKKGKLKLTAQVSDFEMKGIQISGVPFNMVFDVPDTSSMVGDLSDLSDAISQLNDGVGELTDGIGQLEDGAPALAAGSSQVQDGLNLLSGNTTLLTDASAKINGALAALSQQVASEGIDPDQITQLIDALRQLSAALYSGDATDPGLYEGLAQIQGGLDQAVDTLDSLIGGLPTVDATDLYALGAELPGSGLSASAQNTISELMDLNTQAATLMGYWYGAGGTGGIKDGLQSASAGLTTSMDSCQYLSQQLGIMADGLESSAASLSDLTLLISYLQQLSQQYADFNDGLTSFATGAQTLASQYATFDEGLNQYLDGATSLYGGATQLHDGSVELYMNTQDLPDTVQKQIDSFLKDYQGSNFKPTSFVSAKNTNITRVQFVMLTDAIEKPAPPEQAASTAPVEQSFWERLKALF